MKVKITTESIVMVTVLEHKQVSINKCHMTSENSKHKHSQLGNDHEIESCIIS